MNNEIEDTLSEVVADGVVFLTSLTRHYGADKAMAVWEAMNESLGNEVKGKVFVKMLTGESLSDVTFAAGPESGTNAVAIIKCIREYTGYTLKEAKDTWEESKSRSVTVKISNVHSRKTFIYNLKSLGCRTWF